MANFSVFMRNSRISTSRVPHIFYNVHFCEWQILRCEESQIKNIIARNYTERLNKKIKYK